MTEAFNEQTGKAAFEAAAKAGIEAVVGGAGGGAAKVTGKYSVFTLFDVNNFVAELNSAKNRNNIKSLMRYENPRIITSVAIVFNRDTSNKINTSGSSSLKIKNSEAGSPELTVKGNASGETLGSLSNGTVFAYEYSRICWEKRDGDIKVATIEVDRPTLALDDNCPSGTEESVDKL